MSIVTVYGRPGCHLCREAVEMLERLRSEGRELSILEVNIEESPELHAAYLERIPVIEVEGRVISELIPKDDMLRQSLDTLGT